MLSDQYIWKQLHENKILPDLANSFFVEVSLSALKMDGKLLAKYYTTDRKRQYNTATSFIQENLRIKVKKKHIEKLISSQKSVINQEIHDTNYYRGDSLDYLLQKAIAKRDLSEFTERFKLWIDLLLSTAILEKNDSNIFLSTVKPEYFDCLPHNIIVKNKKLEIFDSEWTIYEKYTLYYLLYRYLVGLKLKYITRDIPGKKSPLKKLLKHLGIDFNSKYFRKYKKMETKVYQTVYDGCLMNIRGNYRQSSAERIKSIIKSGINKYLKR